MSKMLAGFGEYARRHVARHPSDQEKMDYTLLRQREAELLDRMRKTERALAAVRLELRQYQTAFPTVFGQVYPSYSDLLNAKPVTYDGTPASVKQWNAQFKEKT